MITIDKSCTIGATTTRIRLTEHDSAHINEKCGPSVVNLYVPMPLLRAFMSAYQHTQRTPVERDRELLTLSEAQARAKVCKRSLYMWMAAGKVEWLETPSGSRRIYADSLFRVPRVQERGDAVVA